MSAAGKDVHEFAVRLVWDGNLGEGTSSYKSYGRQYRAQIAGKPDLAGSADPAFRGDPDKHNPEDLFLVSIAACHMLFYLSLCARNGIRVVAYEDDVRGTLRVEPSGGGRFEEVTLRPRVRIANGGHRARALELHETAHELCFIANSCSAPIRHEATIEVV